MLNPYPTRFKISKLNKEYEFIDLSIPEGFNYMILESLDYIYKKKIIKSIHVVYLTRYIGRNGSNDIIDEDLTVSRNHYILKNNYSEGEVILENRSGTYNTLVFIKGNIKIDDKNLNLHIRFIKIQIETLFFWTNL